MRMRGWLLAVTALAVVILVAVGTWYARAEGETPAPGVPTAAVANPVVSALPYISETEYEPDPFDTSRTRTSRTEVKELILVRADGTIERKRAW